MIAYSTELHGPESEIWKPVAGFEGLYDVSNEGRVRRHYITKPSRIVGGFLDQGYRYVTIGKAPILMRRRIAVLVAEAFIGPREPGMQVCHIDGVRDNDRVENLMWGDAKLNASHRVAHGTSPVGEANGWSKLTEEDVREIRATYVKRSHDRNSFVLAKRYGISSGGIRNLVNGRGWGHLK